MDHARRIEPSLAAGLAHQIAHPIGLEAIHRMTSLRVLSLARSGSHANHREGQRPDGSDLLEQAGAVVVSLPRCRHRSCKPGLPVEAGRMAGPGRPADLRNRQSLLSLGDDERLLRIQNRRYRQVLSILTQSGSLNEVQSRRAPSARRRSRAAKGFLLCFP